MTYQPAFSAMSLRSQHVALNPVTGVYEKFVALDSANLSYTQQSPKGSMTSRFVTQPSTNNQAPDGTSTATMVQNQANEAPHGIDTKVYDGVGSPLPADKNLAAAIVVKAGTITKLKVAVGALNTTIADEGAEVPIATFDISAGTRLSGSTKINIRPVGWDNPAYSGWYEIYTSGIVTDGVMGDRFVVKGLNSAGDENYLGTTSENWFYWYATLEYDGKSVGRLFVPFDFVGNSFQAPSQAEILAVGMDGLATPQAMSIYLEWLDRGNASAGISPCIFRVGDLIRTAAGSIELIQSSSGFTATYQNNAGTSVSSCTLATSPGDLVGALVTLSADGACQLTVFKNTASAVAGTAGTARGFDGSWSDSLLCLNSAAGSVVGDMYLSKCSLHYGVQPISRLRGR